MILLNKLLTRWFIAGRTENGCEYLYAVDRMQAILDRERMRCDRGNSSFALLTLSFAAGWTDDQLSTIARTLRDRLRATDDAGLWRARTIAVILPETSAAGAHKVADDLCDLLPQEISRPKCKVYVYPGDEARPGDADQAVGVAAGDQSESRQDEHMHALFVRRMPAWKRAIDVLGSATALVILSPFLLLVAAAIKLTSPGPVIFKQRRDTIGGRRFMIYKFRTMSVDAEALKAALRPLSEQDGPAFKIAKDPRVTRLGRVLRATSIDELPQLVNVLLGDMTLVGPRAMCSKESSRCERWQRRRLDVTAGLTCIWQVRGRSAVPFSEWMRMDLRYIQARSLATDLKLITQTVPAVVMRRGAC